MLQRQRRAGGRRWAGGAILEVYRERERERERDGISQIKTIKHRVKVNPNGLVMFSPVRFPPASLAFGFATNFDKLVRL